MAKQRLYDQDHPQHAGAQFTLHLTLLTLLKLFAPILPHVTEWIYQSVFANTNSHFTDENPESIHNSKWPVVDENLIDDAAEKLGDTLVDIAIAVRRYKSERNLSLGTELKRLQLVTIDPLLQKNFGTGKADLISITRALQVEITPKSDPALESISISSETTIGIES